MSFVIQSPTHEDYNFQYPEATNNLPIWGKYLSTCKQETQLPDFWEKELHFYAFLGCHPSSCLAHLCGYWRGEDHTVSADGRTSPLPVDTLYDIAKATLDLRGWRSQWWVSLWGRLSFFTSKREGCCQNLRKLFLPRGPEWVWISLPWTKTSNPTREFLKVMKTLFLTGLQYVFIPMKLLWKHTHTQHILLQNGLTSLHLILSEKK